MNLQHLALSGAFRLAPDPISDHRGFFSRLYCESTFREYGLNTSWINVNSSRCTKTGTLRGLHFQRPPMAEAKLIKCTQGVIYDVIVDLREGSSTYGQWHGEELSSANLLMIYVPCGFAHGYLSLTDGSEVIYLSSSIYSKAHQGNLNWSDPSMQISWPVKPLIMSNDDQHAPYLESITPIPITA